MANNVANTLTSHYSDLKTSTERLSTGLRVNSAADDAAGLAIRELMRTDITALQQGVRNANDAISLLQTADGALAVIDEKLTRMKELAEQDTYDDGNDQLRHKSDLDFFLFHLDSFLLSMNLFILHKNTIDVLVIVL